jgi:hypothetical protein
MSTDDRYPVDAPGWAALDRVFSSLYPGSTPHQFTSKTAYDVESPSPLPAITVFEGRGPEAGSEFWHYVTYGLTELFEKASPQAEISGFGFELTFRLPRDPASDQPPAWPLRLLQGLGQYVLAGHGSFDTGHVVDLGGPIVPPSEAEAVQTRLEGVVTIPDPAVGKMETPHGSVLFLLLFGLCRSEVEAMGQWEELPRKVGLVREVAPLGITRLDRVPFEEDDKAAPVYRRYALNVLAGEV